MRFWRQVFSWFFEYFAWLLSGVSYAMTTVVYTNCTKTSYMFLRECIIFQMWKYIAALIDQQVD
jgi:hypothetical protein